ncbi:MAG: YicC family protein [Crocinitomicaceae bacterium]|nr:YicC family protein [Crocinitomicaceae bacterium]|tara:strand:- start:5727 stop:6608 length:882 start_codon:yes stop_codon:yes gene_type:complete
MLLSMTGFGKSESLISDKKITVEIKSLNSKFLDLNLKSPTIYRELELPIRTLLAKKLIRGKVEVFIHLEQLKQDKIISLNQPLIEEYYKQLKEINNKLDPENKFPSNLFSQVFKHPDVIINQKQIIEKEEKDKILKLVENASDNLSSFRTNEGKSLFNELTNQTESIKNLLQKTTSFEKERIPNVKEKLANAINELLLKEKIDSERLEQELIYYAEKIDITEEKVRLEEHCNHFLKTANETKAIGKKLGFITQEMGREINTLGSKAHHLEIQKIVVTMKDHLEKIKEQVLNVL